jgi:PAS domain S-box-containing protein
LTKIGAGEAIEQFETTRIARDGRKIEVSVTISPLRDQTGEITGASKVYRDIGERKRIERALRKSLKDITDLRAALDQHASVAVTDPHGAILFVNDRFCALSKYPRDELLGQNIRMLNSGFHPQSLFRDMWTTISNGLVWRGELRNRARDGSLFWIDMTIAPVLDVEGQPRQYIAIRTDITARKRAEERLLESELRTRLATEAVEVGIWEWNIFTDRIWWDDQMFRIYGREPTGDGFVDYGAWASSVLPSDLPEQDVLLREHAREGGVHRREFRIRRTSDGACRFIQASETVRANDRGQTEWVVGTNLDVTDRRRAEEDLRKSHLLMAHAAEAARLTYGYLDLATGRFDVAGNFADVMGYAAETPHEGATPAQVIGNLLKHIHPDDRPRVQAAYLAFMGGQLKGSERCRICADDGGIRWVEGTWSAGAGPDGKPGRLILTSLDVTALVAGNIALEAAKAEAERAKSMFLAAASHDLRQPVQSLVLLLAVVERQASSLPTARKATSLMKTAIDGLQGLLGAVLDISRLDAGVVDPAAEIVDLGSLLVRLEDEYAPRAASQGLDLRASPRRLFVRTDPNLLGRILRNLIENALRYTSQGGILIGVRRRGRSARIDIFDTGVGIPAEKQSEIFEEFRQLHNPGRDLERGLGLGLAIVTRLAALLGARIDIASKVGRGSRFSVLLPLVEHAVADVDPVPTEIKDPGGRVLIIEDNATVRGSLETMLEESGYQTRSAACGEDALALAAEEDWRYEALIVDHQLGAGLTGVETAREFERRAGRPFATLMLTGDTARERIAEIDASGFEMLHKPIAATDLRRKLAELI